MTATRESATNDLVTALRSAYPEKGFTYHPSLTFKAALEGGGISAKASMPITKDTILLVIPDSSRLRISHADALSDEKKWGLPALLKKIECGCKRAFGSYGYQESGDHALAVLVMRARAMFEAGQTTTLWSKQAATWPSKEELQGLPMYWEESHLNLVGRDSMSCLRNEISERQRLLRELFDGTIYPLLKEHSERFIVPSTIERGASSKEALWQSFLYGFSIMFSRCHDGKSSSPELLPLVDLFNGVDDRGQPNVSLASGMWPFIQGPAFTNECNISCSAVYATRGIEEGEELFISYGALRPSEFLVKYGTIPSQMITRDDMLDRVQIYCPPDLIPDQDALRVEALKNNGFPLEDLKSGVQALCELDTDSFMSYRGGSETPDFASLRQFVVLGSIADDDAVKLNIQSGRLRCNLKGQELCSLLCRVIEYNIENLSASKDGGGHTSSAEDLKRASEVESHNPAEAAALLGRVCQREILAMWRHLICRKYNWPSHADGLSWWRDFPLLKCFNEGGCRVCGRTYLLRKCARCKWKGYNAAAYCSRKHQKMDWREHKQDCEAE